MGSSRLPGKVLMDINGQTALERLVSRLKVCKTLDEIVVATTKMESDDPIERWCSDHGVACFRGSENDVLHRVVEAHKFMGSEIVVEITGDCPMTDPELVDLGVLTYFANCADVVTNCGNVLTWPMGLYVQVFSLKLLEQVASTVSDPSVREHVSLYFYENLDKYQVLELIAPERWRFPNWRCQLDYPEDLRFQNAVFQLLELNSTQSIGIEEIVSLLKTRPDLLELNIHCKENSVR